MTGEQLRIAIKSDERLYGTLIISTSPRWPEAVKALGLDFVFIDTEHVAIDRAMLSWMCQTYRALEIAPVVRITSPDPYEASTVLDGGACGIIAPYVESVDQVKRLVGAVKLRPLKGQKLRRILQGEEDPDAVLSEYLEDRNAGNTLVVNIESLPAMEALDEILTVPGLDAVLVGPHDLSCSMDLPEQYDNPRFIAAVDEIITKARSRGLGAGIHVAFKERTVESHIHWAEVGANFIVHSSDLNAFRNTIQSEIAQMRNAVDGVAIDESPQDHQEINI
jgi:4-hydroxy-2-oxoheptanedioate aldolase